MKNYLITGASRGIGRAIACRLASNDVHMWLHGRDKKALAGTEKVVMEAGATSTIVIADLATEKGQRALIDAIGDGSLDLLINNAGTTVVKPVEELSLEDWNRVLAVNVTAPFMLTSNLVPQMKTGSSIVNILSTAARTGFPDWSVYCMSKFALEGFSQSLREELRPKGIRVLNVYPAATATDIWDNVPGDWPKEKMIKPEEIAEAVYFAVTRPSSVQVSTIDVGNIGGSL